MDQKELDNAIELHRKWLHGEDGGERMALHYANLEGANLSDANLSYADLRYANLKEANLTRADLRETCLDGVCLKGANLTDAKMNWTSHNLIAELLFRDADTDSRRNAAKIVRNNTLKCWGDFIRMKHPEQEWALDVLRKYVGATPNSYLANRYIKRIAQ